MVQRALIEQRPWLLASIVAGIGYYLIAQTALPDIYEWAIKGAGAAFLAIYALTRHQGRDARQIAVVMAFGALGDVLIELDLVWGALAFLLGHLIAIQLYLRHHRTVLSPSQKLAGLSFLVLIPLIAFFLPVDRSAAPGLALYATGLGAMTAAAWSSTFSRYRVGIGAVMFAVSDLLIFSRMGPLSGSVLPDFLIWPLYYFGQFLICIGVVGEIGNRASASP
jgi:uncharacterized membrane protein YhhN